ncbi:MAG: capsule biosynthesis protein [Acetobacteraceae bacterium]
MKLLRDTSGSRPVAQAAAPSLAPPAPAAEPPLPRTAGQIALSLPGGRGFFLGVIVPLLLASVYFLGIAADQYVSEARFSIRSQDGAGQATSPLGELLGGAGMRGGGDPGLAVRDYLQSVDALNELRRHLDVVSIWRRPEADFLARLWWEDPPAERLLWYMHRMVRVAYEPSTGITVLEVRAFRPEDARAIAERLLIQAENLVNRLSERGRADRLRLALEEVALAERRVVASREAMINFRERQAALDPAREAAASLEAVIRLEATVAATRAELQERLGFMRPDNPQILVLRNRIESLEREITEARRRITVGEAAVPAQIATFERLSLEREFADRQLASAIGSLEMARIEANRQQMYLARIVEPNLAEFALHPRTTLILFSMAAVLLALYGVGWLVAAGIREHARL